MEQSRIQTAFKALLLIGMGLFLYSRLANGTLFYYINERFAGFTMLAVFGLFLVGISYRFGGKQKTDEQDGEHEVHTDDHHHDHHDHHHSHQHALTFGGAFLVALPILLGILVPPQPLGASALASREMNVNLGGSAMPAAVRDAMNKASTDKNILEWLQLFQTVPNPATEFAGEEANVKGFVFRDERFGEDEFSLVRYTLSCCVADASVVALVVQSPEAATLENDQWIEVTGRFAAGEFDGTSLPILISERIVPTEVPNQPYLYP